MRTHCLSMVIGIEISTLQMQATRLFYQALLLILFSQPAGAFLCVGTVPCLASLIV